MWYSPPSFVRSQTEDWWIYEGNLSEPFFSMVRNGLKTVEIRLAKEKYGEIKKGNFIRFWNRDAGDSDLVQNVIVRVINVTLYKTFEDALLGEGIEKAGFSSLKEGIETYVGSKGIYSTEDIEKYDIVAFEVTALRL